MFLCLVSLSTRAEEVYDLVIYGGTSAGVVAAVQASKMGKIAVLIEPSQHLGGLSSGGLGATDIGNKRCIGGLAREFYHRVWRHYQRDSSWTREKREEFQGPGHSGQEETAWAFEPSVAERIFRDWIEEAKVTLILGERLDFRSGVKKNGQSIASIRMESGREFVGRMFIDATYEGDLMAKAGVSYTVGREGREAYGEDLNGIQTERAVSHQFIKNIDPYRVPGDPQSGLLPGIQAEGPTEEFRGDKRVQAYCFRLCATDVPINRLPWPKPKNYDEMRYELLLRNFEAGDLREPWHPLLMPNRKTDANNNFAVSTDNIGMNYAYPEADYATRATIVQEHEDYQNGLMWTLANHPRVPAKVREHFQTWGLAKDEFVENGNWPRQLYVREARRMIGDYVMIQANCLRERVAEDSLGMGAYNMDSHHVRRFVTQEGYVRNEGDVQVRSYPYPISYRSVVPKRGECGNLFAPTCLSASHIAFGSIRMEPVFMVLGQSCATAAALAIDADKIVQDLDYAALKSRLLADGQVLDFKVVKAKGLKAKDLAGLVVDDSQAALSGFWGASEALAPFVGDGYRHDRNTEKGRQFAKFLLPIKEPGLYEVRLAYTADPNRASNVPVEITSADGVKKLRINQREAPPIDGVWRALGRFSQPSVLVLRNDGTDGYVIADAVQVVRLDGE